jgi:MFS family permease
MSKKQLIALFVCNLVVAAYGLGLTGLLPVYATRLGADSTLAGLYLSSAFLALAISTVVAGRLADRIQRRKAMLIISAAVIVPLSWLMGQASSLALLMVLTAGVWFAAGFTVTMINILTGLFAAESERGRLFGIIGLSGGVGGVLGSLASGPIVDRWGFTALFTLAGLMYIIVPIAGLFVEDKFVPPVRRAASAPVPRGIFTNRTFLFLFCASILAHIANSQLLLGRPLIMDRLHFDATAISSAGAVGALIAIPLPLLIGWLSDRLGRKPLIMITYLGTAIALLILAPALEQWQFWAACALQNTLGTSLVVGSALVADIFPRESLGTPLSLFGATPWIGFVVGFGASGAAINAFQMTPTLIIGAFLALVGIVLLIPIQGRAPQPQIEAA